MRTSWVIDREIGRYSGMMGEYLEIKALWRKKKKNMITQMGNIAKL